MKRTSSASSSSSMNLSYFSAFDDFSDDVDFSAFDYAGEQLQEASKRFDYAGELLQEASKLVKRELFLRTFKFKGKHKETGETSHGAGETSHAAGETSHTLIYCGICMDSKSGGEMFRNQNCSHLYCGDCIGRHVTAKIEENIITVRCPEPKCKGVIEAQYCRSIIPKEVLDRWQDALCENVLHGLPKLYCPFKDCSAMMICDAPKEKAKGKAVTVSECPHCHRLFCADCKVPWHSGANCAEFQIPSQGGTEEQMVMELAKTKSWKRCPKCNFYVERIDGCTRISCRCGNEFCYACGIAWSNNHYLCRT